MCIIYLCKEIINKKNDNFDLFFLSYYITKEQISVESWREVDFLTLILRLDSRPRLEEDSLKKQISIKRIALST